MIVGCRAGGAERIELPDGTRSPVTALNGHAIVGIAGGESVEAAVVSWITEFGGDQTTLYSTIAGLNIGSVEGSLRGPAVFGGRYALVEIRGLVFTFDLDQGITAAIDGASVGYATSQGVAKVSDNAGVLVSGRPFEIQVVPFSFDPLATTGETVWLTSPFDE